jgi:hypothetical protein
MPGPGSCRAEYYRCLNVSEKLGYLLAASAASLGIIRIIRVRLGIAVAYRQDESDPV